MFDAQTFYSQARQVKSVGLNVKMQNPFMQLRKIVNHPYLVKWEVDVATGNFLIFSLFVQLKFYFIRS